MVLLYGNQFMFHFSFGIDFLGNNLKYLVVKERFVKKGKKWL
ncbi:hypothetical protein CNEO4_620021 [Clostridium neonatale]|nr:hypothetical protein CNEO4_620021 [Clostridium neonatale]